MLAGLKDLPLVNMKIFSQALFSCVLIECVFFICFEATRNFIESSISSPEVTFRFYKILDARKMGASKKWSKAPAAQPHVDSFKIWRKDGKAEESII